MRLAFGFGSVNEIIRTVSDMTMLLVELLECDALMVSRICTCGVEQLRLCFVRDDVFSTYIFSDH